MRKANRKVFLEDLCETVSLEEVGPLIDTIIKGQLSGRVVIDLAR